MRSMKRLLAVVSLFFVLTRTAHAYIDPGTGGILIQFVIAGLAGGVVWFRNQIAAFLRALIRPFRRKDK